MDSVAPSPLRHPGQRVRRSLRVVRVQALLTGGTVLALLAAASAVQAIQAGVGGAADQAVDLPARQTAYVFDVSTLAGTPALESANRRLAAALGHGWRVGAWNPYTATPRLAYGPGVVVAPGGLADAAAGTVEALARDLIARHPALFASDGSDLERLKVVHATGKWSVVFQQHAHGVPVRHATVTLGLTDDGALVLLGTNVYRIDVPAEPTIERPVAVALARAAVDYDPRSPYQPVADGLEYVPVHRGPGAVEIHLTHTVDVPTRTALWRTHVDAHTGDIVLRHDLIDHAYSGRTEGDVEEFSYCDGMTPELPFAHMWVDITGVGVATSDSNGDFSIGGDIGPASYMAAFDGPDFDVECIGCANATLSGVIQPGVPASLYFDDAVARPDERDSFHFANRTEDFIRSIDPTFDLPKYSIEVNYDATCNATHNWSARRLRFYREGGGCANTGRIGGVVAHEFGHGVQGELMGGGDQAEQGLGEGNSDISATFITDDPVIGRGFYLDQCDGGLTGRNCDNDLIYPDDVIGQAIHSAGRVICGFNWDLRVLLEAKMGAAAGKAYTAYLWHFSRKLFGSPSMTQPDQVMAYLTVDDDDGDLTNGTPNWAEIYEAAEHHGFGSFFPPNPNRIDIVHQPLVDRDDPTGPYVVEADIQVFVAGVAEAPGATELHYALDGGAYANVPLVAAGGTTYLGEIPEQPAGTTITYYLRVDHPSGLEAYHPEDAPSDYHMFGVGPFTLVADHQMEVEEGWTVGAPSDSVEDGEWERADPVGIEFPAGSGVIYQTEDDHTAAPGVQCWVTENPPPGSFPWIDELDGRTSINSPVFDLSTATMVKGSVWYHAYFSNGNPPTGDYLDVKMTTDGGTTWTILAHLTDATTDWTELTFRLSPIDFDFTSQVQFRFTAEDVEPNGVTEAEIDDFHLEVLEGGAAAVEGPAAGAAPLALRLEPPSPNPFNPATAIRFSLPERGTVHLAIYDVGGRLVRGLVDGPREAGHHAVRWDGRDAGGGAAASGVYYARLVVGDRSATRTLVLVK